MNINHIRMSKYEHYMRYIQDNTRCPRCHHMMVNLCTVCAQSAPEIALELATEDVKELAGI